MHFYNKYLEQILTLKSVSKSEVCLKQWKYFNELLIDFKYSQEIIVYKLVSNGKKYILNG